MLDLSVGYTKYQFLGGEFLTWLWYTIENPLKIASIWKDEIPQLLLGDRMVLENRSRENLETITIKGTDAGLEEGYLALRKGSHVTELNLICRVEAQSWRFTIKGENLALTNFKTPLTGKISNSEEVEGALIEKAYLYEMVFKWLDTLFNHFIKLRLSDEWTTNSTPDIRKWILDKHTMTESGHNNR